jgi:hypothetical protein
MLGASRHERDVEVPPPADGDEVSGQLRGELDRGDRDEPGSERHTAAPYGAPPRRIGVEGDDPGAADQRGRDQMSWVREATSSPPV